MDKIYFANRTYAGYRASPDFKKNADNIAASNSSKPEDRWKAISFEAYREFMTREDAAFKIDYKGKTYQINVNSLKNDELSDEAIACLLENYDIDNMSREDYLALFSELSQQGFIGGKKIIFEVINILKGKGSYPKSLSEFVKTRQSAVDKDMNLLEKGTNYEFYINGSLETLNMLQENVNFNKSIISVLDMLIKASQAT